MNATTPLNVVIDKVKYSGATISGRFRDTPTSKWREYIVINPVIAAQYNVSTGPELLEATNECSSLFFKKLRDAQRAISGPTFVGELRQTLRMIKRPASSLRDYTISWANRTRKKTKGLKGKPLSKALTDSYLEYQFGVKPLLADTKAGAQAMARLLTGYRVTRVSAYAVREAASVTWRNETVYVFSDMNGDQVNRRTAVVAARAGLRAQAKSSCEPSLNALLEVTGFNWSEFVPTAWELLPWSFLVDYFSNVGNVLTAVTTDVSQLAWYSRGTKYTRTLSWRPKLKQKYDAFTSISEQFCGGWETSRVEVTRTGVIQYPSLSFQIPGIGQVANMAALWNSLRKH